MTPSKVDLSEFIKYSRLRKKPCPIGLVATQLKEAEKQLLLEACKNFEQVANTGIAEWLRVREYVDISINMITSHRKGTCSCGKS